MQSEIIGVDIGGTKILAARISNKKVVKLSKALVPKSGSQEDVMRVLFGTIEEVYTDKVNGIGVGVPSIVNPKSGVVYDVQNIPSWIEVPLGKILIERYNVPVHINNDANCFAVGEKYFGKGQSYNDIAAVIIGTGMAAGLILNRKLYNGRNCGAGEFGMLPYLEHNYEYYASGQYFQNAYQENGFTMYERAKKGDLEALNAFKTYGNHLGNALNAILYSIDPEVIILGGSVSKAYDLFEGTMKKQISKLAYSTMAKNINIKVSADPNIAVLGAASLLIDSSQN